LITCKVIELLEQNEIIICFLFLFSKVICLRQKTEKLFQEKERMKEKQGRTSVCVKL